MSPGPARSAPDGRETPGIPGGPGIPGLPVTGARVSRPGRSMAAILRLPGVLALMVGNFTGNVANWASLFAGTLALAQAGAGPLATQLIAFLSALPMAAGGLAARRLRIDPDRRIRRLRQVLLLEAAGALVVAGGLALGGPLPLVYLASLTAGIGQVSMMVFYRPELFSRVGHDAAPRALSLDGLLISGAILLGPFLMGLVQGWSGPAAVFLLLGAGYLLAARTVRRAAGHHRSAPQPASPSATPAGRPPGPVRRSRFSALTAVVGVTVIVNVCYLPLQSLVPLLGRALTDKAPLIGILAAAGGAGMLIGNSIIVGLRRPALAALFICGPPVSLLSCLAAAQMSAFWAVFAFLVLAGVGGSAFTTTQSALVMRSTPAENHSSAMGSVAVAISTLPVGALASGRVSQSLGTPTGFVVSAVAGLLLWLLWLPVCLLRLRTHA